VGGHSPDWSDETNGRREAVLPKYAGLEKEGSGAGRRTLDRPIEVNNLLIEFLASL
jgi:hypothetical protein